LKSTIRLVASPLSAMLEEDLLTHRLLTPALTHHQRKLGRLATCLTLGFPNIRFAVPQNRRRSLRITVSKVLVIEFVPMPAIDVIVMLRLPQPLRILHQSAF
jgi:hypothetical protein